MGSSSKKRKTSEKSNGIDRLSELPDHILVHILTFLPILDAVRTVLIRRFGNLWTFIPSIRFNDFDFWQLQTNHNKFLLRYPEFVRNVLVLHNRVPIDSFKLYFSIITVHIDDNFVKKVPTWIKTAIDKEVKELEFFRIRSSILPDCVFTSQFLVTLKLVGCQVTELLSHLDMKSLRKLSLNGVETSNDVLKKFIRGCPSLQELDLCRVTGLNELCSPNIKKLCLVSYDGLIDCPNLTEIDCSNTSGEAMQVLHASSVRQVNITRCCYLNVFEEYLEKFCNAEVFKYYDGALLQMSNLENHVFPQTTWKRLHVKSVLRGYQLSILFRVLRSSPHLEELIVCSTFGPGLSANILYQKLPHCLMPQLKTVTLSSCYEVPCRGLLHLAEILLTSCVTLEKMVVLPNQNKLPAVNELKFVKQLLSIQRASNDARIIFGSEIY